MSDAADLSAREAARAVAAGELRATELAEACLKRIAARDEAVEAWAFLDRDKAMTEAEERDRRRQAGMPLGPLHGVPVGVKDIIDTHDFPTENGSPLHAGRRPQHDAAVTERLRAAGAVILGKTVTTEFALYHPGKTRNPHDPERTPGGSSSGSAAAVADFMVPLAIGSQTNGSVIRPAAFCGVHGFKPSHGRIPRRGVCAQSRALDTVGTFARSLDDLALVTEPLIGHDPGDPDTRPEAGSYLRATLAQEPPVRPKLAFARTPVWDHAADDTKAAFADLVAGLGADAEEVELPPAFERAVAIHRTIMEADVARSFAAEYDRSADRLSARLREVIERGRTVLAVDYNAARDAVPELRAALEPLFARFDAILTPPAPGEAPRDLSTTGNPIFCTIWTLLGTPAVTLPLLRGSAGMPIGVQLTAQKGDDARLLRTARWLVERVAA